MTWFLHCISLHPEEQQKLHDEMERIFDGDDRRPCTPQDVVEMKYLECCIKETLRLYPSVPGIIRSLTKDVQIGRSLTHSIVSVFLFCLPTFGSGLQIVELS